MRRGGLINVKSRYWRATQNVKVEGGSVSSSLMAWWSKLWNLGIPSKIKIFAWKLCHYILPVQANLARRGINTNKCCCRCQEAGENAVHALVECPSSVAVWFLSLFSDQVSKFRGDSGLDLCLFLSKIPRKSSFVHKGRQTASRPIA